MTTHALFSRWLPVLYLIVLWLLAAAWSFNGLYGQDTHGYLHQFRLVLEHLQVQDHALFAALRGILQSVSMLSAALCMLVFERLLRWLAHGSRSESRWIFSGLGVALAPMFLHSGLTVLSDAPGLLMLLSSYYVGFRSQEKKHLLLLPLAVMFGSVSVVANPAFAALLLPFVVWLWVHAWQKKRPGQIIWSMIALVPGVLLYQWVHPGFLNGASWWQDWSLQHFFQTTFTNDHEALRYALSNILYVWFPLAHPGFMLLLPFLLLLAKKTDVVLPEKKILLLCTVAYLLLLGGLPFQQTRFLLPVYFLWLFMLFPAWDRMYCYGLIFFRKTTIGIIAMTLAVQLAAGVWTLWPVMKRNRLELRVAEGLKDPLPAGAILYTNSLGPALRTYLPHIDVRYLPPSGGFPEKGAYLLLKTAGPDQQDDAEADLRKDLQEQEQLLKRMNFPDGWTLWALQ